MSEVWGEPKIAKTAGKEIKWFQTWRSMCILPLNPISASFTARRISAILAKFRHAAIVQFKAKDIFRASQLSLLGVSNSHVEKDRQKISGGKALSPLLLLRDEQNSKVIVADGYHRLCAVYSFNEDALIQCKIV